jgi:hypothetical protein
LIVALPLVFVFLSMLIILINHLAGLMHAHVAFATHTGGGAEEILNTANYGKYVVPQGQGRWLYGLLCFAATADGASYARIQADEWDGEDLYVPMKNQNLMDPDDIFYLKRPRFCPGGAVISAYSLHNANEVVYAVLLFRENHQKATLANIHGDSQVVVMAHNTNTTAAQIFETTGSYKFPATKGPYAIVSGVTISDAIKGARLIIPNSPNSARPLIHCAETPKAGVEGPILKAFYEPIIVPESETIEIEHLIFEAKSPLTFLEIIPGVKRADVPSGQPETGNTSPTLTGASGARLPANQFIKLAFAAKAGRAIR